MMLLSSSDLGVRHYEMECLNFDFIREKQKYTPCYKEIMQTIKYMFLDLFPLKPPQE